MGAQAVAASSAILVLISLQCMVPRVAAKAVLPSGSGAWFGTVYQPQNEPVASYIKRVGFTPAVFNIFVKLPLDDVDSEYLQSMVSQVSAAKAMLMLTAEPSSGLAAVTSDAISELSSYIRQAEQGGSPVMVRYAHEMNGAWYAWGQQAADYISSFRKVASQLRSQTCGVTMVWAPNAALGYPWRDSSQAQADKAPPGSANFNLMDTNGNGMIDAGDDPFGPYYPGDQYVDWVGTSIYHFGGQAEPFISNQIPSPYAFNVQLTGGASSDSGGQGNLYARFSGDDLHKKPMIIAETAAEYLPNVNGGASELEIKSAWWQQAMNTQGDSSTAFDISVHYPMIRALCWFDMAKPEGSSNDMVADWEFSSSTVLGSFKQWLYRPAESGAAQGAQFWKMQDDVAALGKAAVCSKQS